MDDPGREEPRRSDVGLRHGGAKGDYQSFTFSDPLEKEEILKNISTVVESKKAFLFSKTVEVNLITLKGCSFRPSAPYGHLLVISMASFNILVTGATGYMYVIRISTLN